RDFNLHTGDMSNVVKAGVWLYLGTTIGGLFGLIYWVLMSRLVGVEAVGRVGAVVAFATLIQVIFSLDIGLGLARSVGVALRNGDWTSISRHFWTGVTYLLSAGAGIWLALFLANAGVEWGLFSPLLALIFNLSLLADMLLAALYLSWVRVLAMAASGVALIAVGVSLASWGWVGAAVGYTSGAAVYAALLTAYAIRRVGFARPSFAMWIEMAKAGVSRWGPSTLLTAGQQAGILGVYHLSGAPDSGRLYIAQAIAGVVASFGTMALWLATPTLARAARRRELALYGSKVALALTSPLSVALAAGAELPLSILGHEYAAARQVFSVLALSVPAQVFTNVAASYLLSEAMYRRVFTLYATYTATAAAAYMALIPQLGALGAATATLAASTAAALTAAVFLKPSQKHLKAVALPLAIGVLTWHLPPPIATAAALSTYAIYLKAGVWTRQEITNIIKTILQKQTGDII
ncbi:MAG: lipopolysaccharide biosynthesis protein, partial [Pyrobaculum sp.]